MKLVMNHSDSTLVFACFVILLCARPSSGQKRNQLAAKYKEVVAFEIRPGILAFSTFAKDGNVCRVIIERPGYLDGGQNSSFETGIPSEQVDLLVDEVVPLTERGKPEKWLNSDSFVAGGVSLIKQDYENVSVSVYGSGALDGPNQTNIVIIDWPKRGCSFR